MREDVALSRLYDPEFRKPDLENRDAGDGKAGNSCPERARPGRDNPPEYIHKKKRKRGPVWLELVAMPDTIRRDTFTIYPGKGWLPPGSGLTVPFCTIPNSHREKSSGDIPDHHRIIPVPGKGHG